jgi:GMP synthase-like glutamine amidotransferase
MKKKVLGICLGAQMISEVLGGSVFPNREKGCWAPSGNVNVSPCQANEVNFSGILANHAWYSCVQACENQAFAYGEHVLGLQFHLESTTDCIQQMLANCANLEHVLHTQRLDSHKLRSK